MASRRFAALRSLLSSIELTAQTIPTVAAISQGTLACIRAEQGRLQEARDLLDTSESHIRGKDQPELVRLLCKRVLVARIARDPAASRVALEEAQALAERCGMTSDSPVGRLLGRLRAEPENVSGAILAPPPEREEDTRSREDAST